MTHFSHSDFLAIAHAEMNSHGLYAKGWSFKIDNSVSRHGLCNYNTKTLSVTRQRIDNDSKEDAIYTLRHEIAHALHFEQYATAGRENEFFARRWTGRKWVRKVAPHGAEWKMIARSIGVKNPKSANAGNARKNEIQPWRVVRVDGGVVEDMETGYHRFPKNLSMRYLKGRKRDTLGKLFLVKKAEWVAYINGNLTANQLSFYQDLRTAPVPNRMTGMVR